MFPEFERIQPLFRTPVDNIVSLFTYKILQGMVCEVNLCSLSLERIFKDENTC